MNTPEWIRRLYQLVLVGSILGLTMTVLPADARAAPPQKEPGIDWSVAVVESTMRRYTPETLGNWGYRRGYYLHSQYLVYKRTGERRYLDYIKAWVDRFVDANGHIGESFNDLDSMQAGVLLLVLHDETGDHRYKAAADQIRRRLDTYPRTSDGSLWHGTQYEWQLWADSVYMVLPFLAGYGSRFGDSAYTTDEVTRQLILHARHLQAQSGLIIHAWDEKRAQPWADPVTGRSPEFWCRAVGWYAMTMVDILEMIPADHPRRGQLITIMQRLVRGLQHYQDVSTGRWFQVMDKGSLPENWTETSCSAMFTYATSRAVQRGYIDAGYLSVAARGYRSVLDKISLDEHGLANLVDIAAGTAVGDLPYYLARPRETNDALGLASFVIMNEQLRGARGK